ncbi:MAG: hypothetical protein JWM00_591 [Candidatus Saccharibacteria bacterium]|nr:hypothetical protein [Candidatus Saccharibacteria bacterium]
MNQFLINLVLALATVELLHNVMEVSNIRRKVARLNAYITKQPVEEMKMKIDTRPKSYALSFVSFIVLTGVPFGVFSVLNLKGDSALWCVATVLILAYFGLAVLLDKFHVEIERVTRPFMKK